MIVVIQQRGREGVGLEVDRIAITYTWICFEDDMYMVVCAAYLHAMLLLLLSLPPSCLGFLRAPLGDTDHIICSIQSISFA